MSERLTWVVTAPDRARVRTRVVDPLEVTASGGRDDDLDHLSAALT